MNWTLSKTMYVIGLLLYFSTTTLLASDPQPDLQTPGVDLASILPDYDIGSGPESDPLVPVCPSDSFTCSELSASEVAFEYLVRMA